MAKSRRPRGAGSYDKCGEYYRWRIGICDPLTGKTRYKRYKSIKAKTRRDLEAKVAAWREVNGGGEVLPPLPRRMTVERWSGLYLENVRSRLAPKSVSNIMDALNNHLIPNFGKMWIGKVSPMQLQVYFDGLQSRLAPSTIGRIRAKFRACFEQAVKMELIARNPVTKTIPPKNTKSDLAVLEDADVARMLEVAKSGSYRPDPRTEYEEYKMRCNYMIVLVGAASGMRLGEVLGLAWDCVDTAAARLEVKCSLQDLCGDRGLKPSKNGKSRTIAIPSSVAAELEAWREYQARYAEKYKGFFDNPHNLLFTNASGGVVVGSQFTVRPFRAICKAAGGKGARYHDLRHHFASSALAKGVPVQAVSAQLGHSSASITYDVYTHVLRKSRDELREVLEKDELFKPANKKSIG